MDLKRTHVSVKSANAHKFRGSRFGSASGSGLSGNDIKTDLWDNISLKKVIPLSGESSYLTQLWVSGNEETFKELHQSDISHSETNGFKRGAGIPLGQESAHLSTDNIDPHHQNIKNKMRASLKLLTFREKLVLVQFWFALGVGKNQLLTIKDQPFGLGSKDIGLYSYRKDGHNYFVVDKDHKEENDGGPPVRVFRRGLPEWTSDVTNYLPNDFPQKDLAIRCNLRGYLALPVFDSTTGLCVGVIELLMSSKHMSFAYEVQQIHKALKTQNLTCPKAFDGSASNSFTQVPNEHRQNELDTIKRILESVCAYHNLPLAQTWAASASTSFVSHDNIITKCCSSFDTKCIGKACMSTVCLPFHVGDLLKWKFKDECRKLHLEKSSVGVVGRALLSHGSCFCRDVTKLNEEEYPLHHYACIYKLTGCFAIFLHSAESNADYVLEFFLPFLDTKDGKFIPALVETLKHNVEVNFGFELGDTSSIQEVGPPTDLSDSESIVTNISDQCSSTNVSIKKRRSNFTDDGATSMPLKQLKIDSDPVPSFTVKVTFKEYTTSFQCLASLGLLEMKTEVAQRFKLEGKRLSLKYKDGEGDMISILSDDCLANFVTSDGNRFNLICCVTN